MMRYTNIAVLFSVLLLAAICGADSTREQSIYPKDASAVQDRTRSDASTSLVDMYQERTRSDAHPSQLDMYKEMGTKRVADQNGTNSTISKSNTVLDNFSIHMKEIADQESQRDYENRSDPFKIYQSQTQQWMMKRAEKRAKEVEQERRKEFDKELDQERTAERERIRAESNAASKKALKLYPFKSTRLNEGTKPGELSSIEEGLYKAYAEQKGITVEQVKALVKEGKLRASDITTSQWTELFEKP